MSENIDKKQRLLIVDDSKVIRVTARKILRDHFETNEAVDGENAWELLSAEEPFALVVSDLTMPRLDGFGLLERIRSSHLPQLRDIPVIIITGANDTDATMEQARAAGATDFIGKPFDAVHLLARTQAHARSHAVTNTLLEENTALEDKSGVDDTTGLCNETGFMEHGYQQLSYAIRHSSNLAVFRIEIDGYGELFKDHGNELTETVITKLGKTLDSVIREEDTAARTGAARFSLLLPGMNQAGIRNIAERINNNFSAHRFMSGDTRVPVTISIGVCAPDIRRDSRFEELLTTADRHLTQALEQGGNRIVYEETGTPPPGEMYETVSTGPEPAEAGAEAALDITSLMQDMEEINLSDVVLPGAGPGYGQDTAPKIEDLAPATKEPAGDQFAGPVPDERILASSSVVAGHADTVPANDLPADPDAAEPGRPQAGDDEDAILISAPFAAHTAPMPESWTAEPKPGAADSSDEANDAPDTPPRRKGFFRKALGLFGRLRPRR